MDSENPFVVKFCGDQLWDDLLLSSNDSSLPIFTDCFQHTILAGLPCLFFWALLPVLFLQLYLYKNHQPLRWTVLASMQYSLVVILFADKSFLLAVALSETFFGDSSVPVVNYVYPTVQMVTLAAMSFANSACRGRGFCSSGILFTTWMLFVVLGAPEFYAWVKMGTDPSLVGQLDFYRYTAYLVWYPLVCIQFLLFCFVDGRPKETTSKAGVSPENVVSFPNRQFFWWFNETVGLGHKQPLEVKDLFDLEEEMTSSHLETLWNDYWDPAYDAYKVKLAIYEQRQKHREHISRANSATSLSVNSFGPKYGSTDGIFPNVSKKERANVSPSRPLPPSIVYRLFLMFKWNFIGATFVKICSDLLQFASPILLNVLISYSESPFAPLWQGVVCSFAIFVASELRSMFLNNYFYLMFRVGVKIQSVLTSAVFRKTMQLSNESRRLKTVGEIVNLMAIDVDRFQQITPQIQQYWSSPFQILVALLLLYQTIGVSVMSGVAVMLLLIPINFWVSILVKRWQVDQMRLKDERQKMVNEVLNGIKAVKLYAWEPAMEASIERIRQREVHLIGRAAMTSSFCDMFNIASPFLVALLSFATFTLSSPNNRLTPQIAFVSLTLFNQLRAPMMMIADLIGQTVQTIISNRRLKDFLVCEEIDVDIIDRTLGEDAQDKRAVESRNASFTWGDVGERATLSNISLLATKGQLITVIGRVGCGKSSLLSAFLGEMRKLHGYIGVEDELAYVPQQSWILNRSLRDNVLFMKEFSETFYRAVVSACALGADFEVLPDGDLTEIGEKGINLSGGQKARVSLARAIYQDKKLYLLDDPLSAVDVHVGNHIFENVIGRNGLLREKTRILVTHRLTFLKEADLIVIMQGGTITNVGTYEMLMKNPETAEIIDTETGDTESEDQSKSSTENASPSSPSKETETSTSDGGSVRSRKKSRASSVRSKQMSKVGGVDGGHGRIIRAETSETGRVKFAVYKDYFYAMTLKFPLLFCIFMTLNTALQMLRSLWLSAWSDDNGAFANFNLSMAVGERLAVYGALGFGEIASISVALILLIVGSVRASLNLHSPLLHNLLRSPLSFFDVTPLGRILNRIGKDIEVIDLRLSANFRFLVVCLLNVLQTVIIIMLSTPLFVVVVLPISVVYLYILRFFIDTSRQLQRLASVSRSPIYAHFSESIQGASSIRAYHLVEHFCDLNNQKLDTHIRCKYASLISNRWLAVRLEFIGNLITLFAALFAVLSVAFGSITAGTIGLNVSYSLNVTFMLNFLVRQISEVETNIVAVERVKEFCETPTEAPWRLSKAGLPKSWPLAGEIEFRRYSARYRPGLELVLRDVSLAIKAREKIGVVGRTGAGKSSIALALFRIFEAADGQIRIDGVDISAVGLHDLRSNITIIPQDPVLFSGTLRFNLDPLGVYTDAELWSALELVDLKEFVELQSRRLEHVIGESGENLSVGERQLVCLARAILRRSRVVVLDEATASVDTATDALIQETIRREFQHSTVITIAHRLNTVIDYDRIIVMENGGVSECGVPRLLLADTRSRFFAMAKQSKLL